MRLLRSAAVVFLTGLALVGCASTPDSSDGDDAGSDAPASPTTASGEITVYAAASLTDSFEAIATAFEAENPGAEVTFSFGGSSALAEGILSGAPVDVFAAASPATMATVVDAGLSDGDPTTFASNTLEIAVPPGNPGDIAGLADFADSSKVIALCAPEVPCGAAAVKVFTAAGITAAPDTLEEDVKAALTKVTLGEVDAALVYRTDVISAGSDVEGIVFAEAADAVNAYPITVLTDAPDSDLARVFLDFILGDDAQAILASAGFSIG